MVPIWDPKKVGFLQLFQLLRKSVPQGPRFPVKPPPKHPKGDPLGPFWEHLASQRCAEFAQGVPLATFIEHRASKK